MKSRVQALDLVRAAAAIAVLTYHVFLYRLPNPSRPSRDGWAEYLVFELRIGLVVFFVMSGYLLYRPLLKAYNDAPRTVSLGAYYRRRVVRIVPGYWLAIAGSIVLLWGVGETPGVRLPEASDLWLFLFFLQNYSRETLLTLDAPTWTLAVQAAFYLAFPVFLPVAARLGRRAWTLPAILVVAGVVWNWIAYASGWGPIARLSLPAMLPYIALGMLIAHLPPPRTRRAVGALIAAGAVLAIANGLWHALNAGPWALGVFRDLPGAIGYALIIFACAQPAIGAAGWLRPAEALGRWSYGIFLWHLPLLLFMKGQGLMPGSAPLTWAVLVAVSAAVGAAEWRFVERPLLARWRGGG
ncbi:MAG: acyltransferase [Solirubrobacterales bacterium]